MRTVTNDDAEAKAPSYTQAASTTTARALTTGSLRTEQMTRGRKRENIRLTTERDFPHLVELVLPPEGFRGVLLEIDVFHREHRIPVRRGLNRHEVKQVYIRFCFPDAATADAFRNRFGGQCLTYAPDKPKSGPR